MSKFDEYLSLIGKCRKTATALDEINWLRIERSELRMEVDRMRARLNVAGADKQDGFAVYRAMQTISAAVKADKNYRMEWVQNVAAVVVQAGVGVADALKIGEQFVDNVFIKTADEMLQENERTSPINDAEREALEWAAGRATYESMTLVASRDAYRRSCVLRHLLDKLS